jgi:hypothetical protein
MPSDIYILLKKKERFRKEQFFGMYYPTIIELEVIPAG